jgi:ABC-type bacteriocin/lantibiotic exporter with double-glycine peptidase domain
MKSNIQFIFKSIKNKNFIIIIFLLIIIILAIIETSIIGSIYPITEIISNTDKINEYFAYYIRFGLPLIGIEKFKPFFFAFIFSLFFLSTILQIFLFYLCAYLREENSFDWRNKLLSNFFFNKRISFFENSKVGDLMQKTLLHTQEGSLIIYNICIFLKDILIVIFVYGFLIYLSFFYSIFLAFFFIIISICLFIVSQYLIVPTTNLRNLSQENIFTLSHNIFSSIKIIKIFKKEKLFLDRLAKQLDIFKKTEIKLQTASNLPAVVLKFLIFALVLVLVLAVGNENVSSSIVAVYIVGTYKMITSFGSLSNIFFDISRLMPSVAIVKEELATNNNTIKKINYESLSYNSFQNSITFKNINFIYKGSHKLAIKNVNFKILKNSLTVIVGPSGSGKSTLLDVVTGFKKPVEGDVQQDSSNFKKIANVNFEDFSYVSSQNFIFPGSLEENISLYSPVNKKRFDEILEVCELKIFNSEYLKKPTGVLTETGSNISTGQKQRIGIARALYFSKNFLILDEPFSNLEPELEEKIVLNLKNYIKDYKITTLMTTHSGLPLKYSDNIIILRDGVIEDTGNHFNLLKNNDFYKRNFL